VPGAGASPPFSPEHTGSESARQVLLHLCRREPRAYSCNQTRWTLAALRTACDWLGRLILARVHTLLDRLGVVWRRARSAPGRVVAVYLDEVSIERQPTLWPALWAARGGEQPKARLSPRSNTETRLVAALDALMGRVVHRRAGRIGRATLRQFYLDLRAAYPQAERLYVIQDNWPLHFHPDVLVALEPQRTRWPLRRPPNWPQAPSSGAVRRWGGLALPIQIVPLPTYASWLNPIETLRGSCARI